MKHPISRRNFLKLGMMAALPASTLAKANQLTGERQLQFHNLHTGENAKVTYWEQGVYVPESLNEINHILRDYRNDEVAAIDTELLDLLHRVSSVTGTVAPFQIISGYRSPATNQMLRKNSTGVAKRSLHMEGKAIDIRIPGVPLADLHKAALKLQGGGVGYYPRSNFVHVDVGRVRRWHG